MVYRQPLLVVRDLEVSLRFYQEVLGLEKILELDFGANVTLTGGISLQTLDSWAEFLGVNPTDITFGGKAAELYFDEESFDAFAARLEEKDVTYVHPVQEHSWGQRAVRFLDPDGHVIEVGETMTAVCKRFLNQGMTPETIAVRMDVPLDYAKELVASVK